MYPFSFLPGFYVWDLLLDFIYRQLLYYTRSGASQAKKQEPWKKQEFINLRVLDVQNFFRQKMFHTPFLTFVKISNMDTSK